MGAWLPGPRLRTGCPYDCVPFIWAGRPLFSEGEPSGQLFPWFSLGKLSRLFISQGRASGRLFSLVFQRQAAHMKEILSYGRLVARAPPDDRMPIRLRSLHMGRQGLVFRGKTKRAAAPSAFLFFFLLVFFLLLSDSRESVGVMTSIQPIVNSVFGV